MRIDASTLTLQPVWWHPVFICIVLPSLASGICYMALCFFFLRYQHFAYLLLKTGWCVFLLDFPYDFITWKCCYSSVVSFRSVYLLFTWFAMWFYPFKMLLEFSCLFYLDRPWIRLWPFTLLTSLSLLLTLIHGLPRAERSRGCTTKIINEETFSEINHSSSDEYQ